MSFSHQGRRRWYRNLILKIIHCNCSAGCKSCRCSCSRYGLPCTAACGPCQTENCDNPNNTQEVDTEEEDDNQNWTLWNLFYGQRCLCISWYWTAEGHEFNFIMIQQLSDIQSCLNVFLAPKNLGIDIKIIKFESIVMDLRSFGGVGGHFWRHIGFFCYIYRPTSFFMILMCCLPPKT